MHGVGVRLTDVWYAHAGSATRRSHQLHGEQQQQQQQGGGGGGVRGAVLRGVNMCLPSKRLGVLQGKSGSGKSTLLYCMAGLLTPQRGTVERHATSASATTGACATSTRGDGSHAYATRVHVCMYPRVVVR